MDTVNLTKALMKAQKDFPAIERDSENPHFKSRYTSLDRLIECTRPSLVDNGLCVTQVFEEQSDSTILVTRLLHESGEYMESRLALKVDRANMQGLGSAATYARRYALAAILGVASDQDDDGSAAVRANQVREIADRPPRRPEPAKPAPPRTPDASAAAAPAAPAAVTCPPLPAWQKRILGCETPQQLAAFVDKANDFMPLSSNRELWRDVVIEAGAYLEQRVRKQAWDGGDLVVHELYEKLKAIADQLELERQAKEAFGD